MTQFELTADGAGVTALVTCQETVDREANSSLLTITVQLKSRSWYGVIYFLDGTVGDTALSSDVDYAYLGALNTYYPVEQTCYLTAPHNADGSGTAVVTVELRGITRSGGAGSGWRISGSHTVELTPIARASTVGATDGDIGAVSMIAVSRKNNDYTHTLGFHFGSLSGYITPEGAVSDTPVASTATAIAFQIPEEFYYQIPDSPTGICHLTCQTYHGQTPVGSPSTASFTVTANEQISRPALTAQVVDIAPDTVELTGDAGVLVRFCSIAEVSCTAQAQFGAAILEQTPSEQLPAPESPQFSFYALDSRGYRTDLTVTAPMVPYVMLTVNASCLRKGATDNTAVLTVQGSCFAGSFGKVSNELTLTAQAGGKIYTLSPYVEGDQYAATCILEGLDYTQSHTVTVTAWDLLQTVSAQTQLTRGVPVFDWGKNDFAFHVPVTVPVLNGMRNIPLHAWPVGAVVLMTADKTPADSIGGKWERLETTLGGLYLWKRLRSADLLGTAVLGSMILGEE